MEPPLTVLTPLGESIRPRWFSMGGKWGLREMVSVYYIHFASYQILQASDTDTSQRLLRCKLPRIQNTCRCSRCMGPFLHQPYCRSSSNSLTYSHSRFVYSCQQSSETHSDTPMFSYTSLANPTESIARTGDVFTTLFGVNLPSPQHTKLFPSHWTCEHYMLLSLVRPC
jgi:hypothetical protein